MIKAQSSIATWLEGESIFIFHEWYWGDGWVQSRLDGVWLLALNFEQTASLLRLREFLAGKQKASE
ncbi:hypothetical protein QUA71_22230 [Microcoleus sp. MON1_C5]|uniref:hypothetical protein n=1 Tax=Microcoleus sp. MON1_C5 TaxID=2818828 RepID=UPI002FCE8054